MEAWPPTSKHSKKKNIYPSPNHLWIRNPTPNTKQRSVAELFSKNTWMLWRSLLSKPKSKFFYMNTLKLKVLLIIANQHLWRSFLRSVLIWFFTGIIGCTIVHIIFMQPLTFWPYGMSLLCSSPAIICSTLVLYFVQHFKSTPIRVGYALCSILATCSIIIGVTAFFSGEAGLIIFLLSPFIPSAIICFFLIAGTQTLDSYES